MPGRPSGGSLPSPVSCARFSLLLLLLRRRRPHQPPSLASSARCVHATPTLIFLISRLRSDGCSSSELTQIHARLFRTIALPSPSSFLWNSLIRCYLRRDLPLASLRLVSLMSRHGPPFDSHTIPLALKASYLLHFPSLSLQLHSLSIKLSLHSHPFCETALLSSYAKSGDLSTARKLFDQSPHRTLASCNALMSALAHSGRPVEALKLFSELRKAGGMPDDVTMVTALSACGSLGDLHFGLQLHKCAIQAEDRGIDGVSMWNSLLDMYGKCGRIDLAHRVFASMRERNVSTWTTMIMALAMQGHIEDALWCFSEMRRSGIKPNRVTFLCVLSACAHGGLVEEAMGFFVMMMETYAIQPTMAHYGCMVDVLGRAGRLEDAKDMVEKMPTRANSVVLGTILGACEKHGNVVVGRWAACRLIELEPWNDGVYVVLSNIFANVGMWEEAEMMRRWMEKKMISKLPAFSSPAAIM